MPAAQVQHQELNRKEAYSTKFMFSVITKTGHNSSKNRIYHDHRRCDGRYTTKILLFKIYKEILKNKEIKKATRENNIPILRAIWE